MSKKKKYTTSELIKLLRGNEEERDRGYSYIFLQCRQKCFSRGRKEKLSDFDIEDLISESFLRLLMAVVNNLKIKSSVTGYFITIFNNVVNNEMKKRKKRLNKEIVADESLPETPNVKLSEEKIDKIWNVMGQLDEKCRDFIVLHHLEGRLLKEIAEEFGTKPEIVKTEIHRCRKKFIELYNRKSNE